MDAARIARETTRLEVELLSASERIREVSRVDSMEAWIIEVLEKDPILAGLLHLPTEAQVKGAILTLLRANSVLRQPMAGMLAQRTAAFMVTMKDISSHPMRGAMLDPLSQNLHALRGILERYQQNYEHRKTIKLVRDALLGHRLHIYKSSPNEPDLRVALRAFYEDESRSDGEEIGDILDFVLGQMEREVRQPGYVSQPRHAWWAVQTMFAEGEDTWLARNALKLNTIIRHLAGRVEYAPRRDVDFASFIPELHSRENEEIWVAINAMKVLIGTTAKYLNRPNATRLVTLVDESMKSIIQESYPAHDLKLIQSKLMLLYEAVNYGGLRYAVAIALGKEVDLRPSKVGELYYDDTVVSRIEVIRRAAALFLKHPERWTRPVLSSVLISGVPGQGKTELARQLFEDLHAMALAAGRDLELVFRTVGADITSESELREMLDELKAYRGSAARFVLFDEFDKAGFEFCAHFLGLLETPSTGVLTFWVFAQSRCATAEELRTYAAGLEKKALRDFLTRFQMGTIDVPQVRFSPQQKMWTAIGMARKRDGSLSAVRRGSLLRVAIRSDVRSNRDLLGIVSNEMDIRNGLLAFPDESAEVGFESLRFVRKPKSAEVRLRL